MTRRSVSGGAQRRWLRVLLAVVVSILLVASAVVVSRARTGPEDPEALADPTPTATATAPAPDEETPDGEPTSRPTGSPAPTAGALPTDPAAAEELGGEALLAAAREAATNAWQDVTNAAWPYETDRPVYVARTRLSGERNAVEADVTIGFRAEEDTSELVLRLLPASAVLRGNDLEVVTRHRGAVVPHEVDRDGARLLVALDPALRAGEATTVRVRLRYAVLEGDEIADDGGPAGFGLLARSPGVTALGHWLPLLTKPGDDGPMVAWGDVGAFPPAVWSVIVDTDTEFVSGGEETGCPRTITVELGCVWVRGTALRDVSAVAYDAMATATTSASGVDIRAVARRGDAGIDAAAETAASTVRSLLRLGDLAWPSVDVASAPLSGGVVGMEFPGLVVIHSGLYDSMEGGYGAGVLMHEIAHQWFHALVGNGSLSSPVVDESLAQYLSYVAWADEFGEEAARAYARAVIASSYTAFRDGGGGPAAPARPLAEFDPDAYGPLVYGRAALAWIAAEDEVGRDAVFGFLRGIVSEYALDFVSDDELVAAAHDFDPALGAVLERYWLEPAPIEDLPLEESAQRS